MMDPLYYIEYDDTESRDSLLYTDYFNEDNYQTALELLEESDRYVVVSHGEHELPEPIDFDFWLESTGFKEES